MFPYKLIRLPGNPNLNLNLNLIKYNKYKIIAITMLIMLKSSYYNSFTYQLRTYQFAITSPIILIITTKEIIGNFTEKYPKP